MLPEIVTERPSLVVGQLVLALVDNLSIYSLPMKNHEEVIELWPSLAELASDAGKSEEAVRKWKERKWIPPVCWKAVADAAAKRAYPINIDLLASLPKPKRKNLRVRA